MLFQKVKLNPNFGLLLNVILIVFQALSKTFLDKAWEIFKPRSKGAMHGAYTPNALMRSLKISHNAV